MKKTSLFKFIFLSFLLVAAPIDIQAQSSNTKSEQKIKYKKARALQSSTAKRMAKVYEALERIDVRQVKANVVKMLADNPQGSVVIQADEKAVADTIIKVMDGAREAGVSAISLASEPK